MANTCSELSDQQFTVYSIERPLNAVDFFAQAKKRFPLDPPISGAVHWDAFADSISGGLDANPKSRIALVIQDATPFQVSHKPDFEMALECLCEAAKEVEGLKRDDGHEDASIVIVVGVD